MEGFSIHEKKIVLFCARLYPSSVQKLEHNIQFVYEWLILRWYKSDLIITKVIHFPGMFGEGSHRHMI